jgi:GNAT superfamily N-acetyltransferase
MTGESSEVKVRNATIEDLETLVAFNAAMALETEGKELDLQRLRQGVSAVFDDPSRGFYVVAEAGDEIAGQLMITTEWSDWRNGYFWWIQSVYVGPEHRRRGVYRALDSHVRTEAIRDGGVCGLRLYVDRENHVAQSVYSSLDMQLSHYDLFEIDFIL